MKVFLMGAVTGGFAVAGLYFFRFWTETRDRLFLIFALAFWLLGLARLGVALSGAASEPQTWFFAVRLSAYLLILLAIADKNGFWRRRAGGPGEASRPLESAEV